MLNYLWPIFIIISIIYSIFNGNVESINKGIFESCENAVSLTITFLGTICFWSGLMEIVKNTSIIEKLKIILKPVMKKLFKNIDEREEVYNEISMNIIANVLGLGNAATPLGLKAMESLQKRNKHKNNLSEEMLMLIILNTASIQLIPTTVIAIRNSLNSIDSTRIIVPVWIATFCAAFCGIVATKIVIHRKNKGM